MIALQETAAGSLVIESGARQGKRIPITGALRIGRHPYNDLSLGDPSASRYHCWIYLSDATPVLEDLESSNGTFVNDARVRGRRPLRPGDIIRVGMTLLTLRPGA